MPEQPRIVRVPGTRGANVYIVLTEPLTLVDSGLPGNLDLVLAEFERLAVPAPGRLQLLLTHHHTDHAGSAAAIREATGARVVAHEEETVLVDGRRWLVSWRRASTVEVDCAVKDGDALPGGFIVRHAPGHTRGSVCYEVPARGALFLGDLAINNVNRLSRPLPRSNRDNARYEESLRRIATLDVEAGYFGHGPPLESGLSAALHDLATRPAGPVFLRVLRGWRDLRRFSRQMRGQD